MQRKTQVVITGELVEKGEPKTYGKLTKQVAVLKTSGAKFPSYYPITFKADTLYMLERHAIGDVVTVCGFVNGLRWQKRDFNGRPEGAPKYFLEICVKSLEGGETRPKMPDEDIGADAMDYPY